MLSRFIPVFLCFLPSEAHATDWHKTLSKTESSTHIYSVGFYEAPELQVALDKAWEASITNAVKTNLPEALSIKEESTEALNGANYDRTFYMKVGSKALSGIGEASSEGSPKVVPSMRDGKILYRVYRLLMWPKDSLVVAREQVKSVTLGKVTSNRIDSYKQMKEWIKGLECGTTMEDVVEVLGDGQKPPVIIDGLLYKSLYQTNFIFDPHEKMLVRIETKMGSIIKRVCP